MLSKYVVSEEMDIMSNLQQVCGECLNAALLAADDKGVELNQNTVSLVLNSLEFQERYKPIAMKERARWSRIEDANDCTEIGADGNVFINEMSGQLIINHQ